jgi:hypothetical protein
LKKRKGARKRKNRTAITRSPARRTSRRTPRTANELFALPDREREQWEQITRLVSRMRDEGVSLRRAARDAQVSPRTAIRLAGSALRKTKHGRYAASSRDRLLRVLVIPTEDGSREIALRDSRQASEVSRYFATLGRLVHGQDASALRTFRRARLKTLDGETVRLLTDVDALKRLANAGVLSFESIYARR